MHFLQVSGINDVLSRIHKEVLFLLNNNIAAARKSFVDHLHSTAGINHVG